MTAGQVNPSTSPVTSGASEFQIPHVPIVVDAVEVLSLEVPLVSQFRTAYGTMSRKRNLIVRVQDAEGVVGWGEAPGAELPTFSPDTHDSTWYALTKVLAPKLAGRTFEGPGDFVNAWREITGYHGAKHALECAAWSIASQKLRQPLSAILGGVRDAIPVGESFGIKDSISELYEEIELRLSEGYCRIKLKIAPGWDVDVVKSVAERFPAVPLSVDANCGYPQAEQGPWRELDELNLLMIEQPFPKDALCELANLQQTLTTPICLDESATSPGITQAALTIGSGRVVNIKPPRVGGIVAAMAIHDLCAERSIPIWVGGMLESGIGRGFNLAVASLPHFSLPADMSPAKVFYAEDLIEPTFDIRLDGTIAVPEGLGCGFDVAEDRIARYATTRWSTT